MLKKIQITSYNFNMLFSLILFLGYNYFFFIRLFPLTPSPLFACGLIFAVYLLLFSACNILLFRYTSKFFSITFIFFNTLCFYFMFTYNITIDKIMLLNVLETDFSEASDLINWKFILFMLLGVGIPSFLIYKTNIIYAPFKKEFFKRIFTILTCFLIIGSLLFPNYKNIAQFLRNNRSIRYSLVPVNYVGAVISTIKIIRKANHKLITIGDDAKLIPYWNNSKPNLFVFVLGETARAQNFSLGGYSRPTNASLSPYSSDIFYFSDVTSCGTSTAISLPCIFSKYSRRDFKTGSGAYTENVLDILKKAGYNVLWRENNSGCKNNCDRIETEQFCNDYACSDEILLKDFAAKINTTAKNSFVVLHQ